MSKLDFFESFQPTQRDPIQDIGTGSKSFLHDSFLALIYFLGFGKMIKKSFEFDICF